MDGGGVDKSGSQEYGTALRGTGGPMERWRVPEIKSPSVSKLRKYFPPLLAQERRKTSTVSIVISLEGGGRDSDR